MSGTRPIECGFFLVYREILLLFFSDFGIKSISIQLKTARRAKCLDQVTDPLPRWHGNIFCNLHLCYNANEKARDTEDKHVEGNSSTKMPLFRATGRICNTRCPDEWR